MKLKILFVFCILFFSTKLSQGQTAIDSLTQLIKEEKTDTGKIRIHLNLLSYLISKETDSSVLVVRKLNEESNRLNYKFGRAVSNMLIGEAYRNKFIRDSSIIYFRKSKRLFEELIRDENEEKSNKYLSNLWAINEGMVIMFIGQYKYDSALFYINLQENSVYREIATLKQVVNLKTTKSSFFYHTKRYEDAIKEGLELLELTKDTNYSYLYVSVLKTKFLLAKTFAKLDDNVNAKKYYEKCLEYIRTDSIPSTYADPAIYNYANFLIGNATEEGLGGADTTMQFVYYRKANGILDSLLQLNHLSKFNVALFSNAKGEVSYYLKDFQKSIDFHSIAYEYFINNNFKLYSGVVQISISKCYLKLEQFDKALNFALEGLNVVTEENNVQYRKAAHLQAYEVYEAMGKYEKALFHFKLQNELADSLSKEEELVKISDLESKYELTQKEQELTFKEKELELSEEVSESKSKTIWAIGSGLVVVLFLSIFLFKSNRERKIINGFLVEKQEIIEDNLKEKEALLREVHHRVKNNLQVISSMLQLQADRMDDPRVDEVMQEGQERIKSMAIIHQRFYEGEELRDISFGDYLKELTEEIASSYGSKQFIQLNIEDNKERFNIDTSIPLGIIVNELISNAYKHAFSVKEQGEIAIQLIKNGVNSSSLIIKDNGVGLPNSFNIEETQSMGLKLVRILIKQMRGELNYRNESGAKFIITFPSNN